MLSMTAITNKDYCMINTLVATMPNGKKYVFDRDMTEYSIRDGSTQVVKNCNVLDMSWYGVYLWDGEEPTYIDTDSPAFKDIVTNAKLEFELEEDARLTSARFVNSVLEDSHYSGERDFVLVHTEWRD